MCFCGAYCSSLLLGLQATALLLHRLAAHLQAGKAEQGSGLSGGVPSTAGRGEWQRAGCLP